MVRSYRMGARAEAVGRTRKRILDAAKGLAYEHIDLDTITLDEVAQRAGVSAMTVIRRFGHRDRLIKEVEDAESERVVASRRASAGDIAGAVRVLYNHYDELGDWGIRAQARELAQPALRQYLDRARAGHRKWVEETFAPQLRRLRGPRRTTALNALVVATDVLTWKLLCRDMGLPRNKAETIVTYMVTAIARG